MAPLSGRLGEFVVVTQGNPIAMIAMARVSTPLRPPPDDPIHGGMGFTWELSAHLYFKGARSSPLLLGEAEVHRERLAQLIGL